LIQYKGSVTQCNSVMMSTGGETALRGEREGTSVVGLIQILLGQEMKKIYTIDLAGINER
jgi:hypothetical protein